jgi:ribosome-binding protein aMBF1 (putative translation factor)
VSDAIDPARAQGDRNDLLQRVLAAEEKVDWLRAELTAIKDELIKTPDHPEKPSKPRGRTPLRRGDRRLALTVGQRLAFGALIRKQCELRGWSILHLAEEAAIPYSTVYSYAFARTSPTMSRVSLLAEALQVDMDYLLPKRVLE